MGGNGSIDFCKFWRPGGRGVRGGKKVRRECGLESDKKDVSLSFLGIKRFKKACLYKAVLEEEIITEQGEGRLNG